MIENIHHVPHSTPDFTTEAAVKLAELFPEIVADGKVDTDKLKTLLGDDAAESRERFGMTWPGKTQAIRNAQTPTTATLMPDIENSVNWETTQNVVIEGDNLEVLKILQKHYFGQIKMTYIDPPYNTGKDFVYKDDFRDGVENYLSWTGQVNESGRVSSNAETTGRYHSNWLNMMYPRLKLARNLLSKDGVVFISIDENEYIHLRKIADEIFGENNYRNTLIVRRRTKSLNNQFADQGLATLNVGAEYVVVYARSPQFSMSPIRRLKDKVPTKGKWDVFWSNADRPTMRYPLLGFTPETGQWRNSESVALQAASNYQEFLQVAENTGETLEAYSRRTGIKKFIRRIPNSTGKNGGVQHWVAPEATMLRTSLWTDIEVSEIAKEFDLPFDNPKSLCLIQELIKLSGADAGDIVLDFFAGSGTTAHAVFAQNVKYRGDLRSISVQLPEPLPETDVDADANIFTIADVTRERIRRAGNKIVAEESSKLDGQANILDVGFRSYKLVDTNFTSWKANSGLSEEELATLFTGMADSTDDEARPEALLTEVLLKLGFSLTAKIETVEVDGLNIFRVDDGVLMAYLDEHTSPTLDQLRSLVAREPGRLVILEDAFQGNDELKTNLVQECRTHNVDLWTA